MLHLVDMVKSDISKDFRQNTLHNRLYFIQSFTNLPRRHLQEDDFNGLTVGNPYKTTKNRVCYLKPAPYRPKNAFGCV
jgi:hypothetical protein